MEFKITKSQSKIHWKLIYKQQKVIKRVLNGVEQTNPVNFSRVYMKNFSILLLAIATLLVLTQAQKFNLEGSRDYDPTYIGNLLARNPQSSEETKCIQKGYCGDAVPFKSEKAFVKYLSELPEYPIFYRRGDPVDGPVISQAPSQGTSQAPTRDNSIQGNNNDFSQTNNQVASVDEADLIKTDGELIYTISNGIVSIIKAFPYQDAGVLSTIDRKDEYPAELFIEGKFLAIFGSKFQNNRQSTFVRVYSLYFPKLPREVVNYEFEGSYTRGRKANGYVYLISQFGNYFRSQELPFLRTNGIERKVAASNIFYYPGQYNIPSFTSIFAFNLQNPYSSVPKMIVMVVQNSYNIYASESAIYLTHQNYFFRSGQSTSVHKILYRGTDLVPFADGEVPGYTINQYSMDEYNGTFRIATTNEGLVPSSAVYTLDSKLKRLGAVEGIAPSERIFSTRFIKNILYLVTFRQVDPFFTVDLSNPRSPKIIGQLKIPGFSRYLHPFDDTTIIGLGQAASDDGRILGLKVSLFDVRDLTKPRQIASYQVEAKYSSSIAEYESRAFLFNREKELLVIPGNYDNFQSRDRFNGAFVFRVTKNSITLRGLIDHSNGVEANFYNSFVERSLFIGNNLYTKSLCLLKINAIQDLKQLKDVKVPCQKAGEIIILPPPRLPVEFAAVQDEPLSVAPDNALAQSQGSVNVPKQ